MNKTGLVLLLNFIIFSFYLLNAQEFYKFKCDITIKEKPDSLSFNLYKGYLEFDRLQNISMYHFYFPLMEQWIVTSDSLIKMRNGSRVFAEKMQLMHNYTVFNLFLNGSLKNYGLSNSKFEIAKVTDLGNSEIETTWIPPPSLKATYGKIIISQKNDRLNGVAIFDTNNSLITKQIYTNYIKVSNLYFPAKIFYIYYLLGAEQYKIIEFSHIVLE